jgi:hypothetical protein
MNAADFRRIALRLEGAEEGSHMGSPDFRVGGRILSLPRSFAYCACSKKPCRILFSASFGMCGGEVTSGGSVCAPSVNPSVRRRLRKRR